MGVKILDEPVLNSLGAETRIVCDLCFELPTACPYPTEQVICRRREGET